MAVTKEFTYLRKKLVYSLLISLLFVAAGIWMLTDDSMGDDNLFSKLLIRYPAGISCILLFGLGACLFARRLFTRKHSYALALDESGLLVPDFTNRDTVIYWKDIRYFTTYLVARQRILVPVLENPKEYIEREPMRYKKIMMRMNLRSYGSPFGLSASIMNCSFEEIVQTLQQELDAFRQQQY